MSKQSLALSPKFLSRLSYHWIWGLRLDRKGDKNFYEIVQELDANAELLGSIKNQTDNILNNRGLFRAIFRIFYWVFNINQYCHNYYKLQAYYAWRKYEGGIKIFSESERESIDSEGGFIEKNDIEQSIVGNIYDAAVYCFKPVKWCVVKPFVWGVGGIRMIFFKDETSSSLREVIISQDTHFNVDREAQKYLNILGIEATLDSQVSIASVKQCYKKLCIVHHPDKGGNADTFRIINEAYKNLEHHISPDKDIFGLKEKFDEYFTEWRKEHEEADEYIRTADESTRGLAESTRGLAESTRGLAESTRELAESTRELAESTRELAEERKKASEVIMESNILLEEYEKRIANEKNRFQKDIDAIDVSLFSYDSTRRYSPTMFQTHNNIYGESSTNKSHQSPNFY